MKQLNHLIIQKEVYKVTSYPKVIHKIQILLALRKKVIRQLLGDVNIAWEHIPILSYISAHQGCSQQEIAENFILTPSAITISTQKLEKSGYINKYTDKDNLRIKRLMLTENGKLLIDKTKNMFDEADRLMFDDINDNELDQLYTILDKLYLNLKSNSGMAEQNVGPWD